ncbi:hypothetical protein [Lysobacter sp. P5_B9]
MLICAAPLVTAVPWRRLAVEAKPAMVDSSRVITWTGDTELNVSRAMRETGDGDRAEFGGFVLLLACRARGLGVGGLGFCGFPRHRRVRGQEQRLNKGLTMKSQFTTVRRCIAR